MACSVPNLQLRLHPYNSHYIDKKKGGYYLDFFPIHHNGFHGEIHPDSVAVSLDKGAVFEALHHARFSGTAVANQHDFEQEIERFVRGDRHQGSWVSSAHFISVFQVLIKIKTITIKSG